MKSSVSYKQLVLSGLLSVSFLNLYAAQTHAQDVAPASTEAVTTQAAAPAEVVNTASPVNTPVTETSSTQVANPTSLAAAPVSETTTEAATTQAAPTVQVGNQTITLATEKPAVAPVKVNDKPNRLAVNVTTHPESEMAFNWYTTNEVRDSKVLISTDKNFTNPITYAVQNIQVESNYDDRTADGHLIFTVRDNNEQVIGYYTDAVIDPKNFGFTDGDTAGYPDTRTVNEYIHRVVANGLTPNTVYYYKVGSESKGFSPVGLFKTAANESQPFRFIQYTDTQNADHNENVRNEAQYGAQTLKEALATAGDAAFALHTGDFVEYSALEDEWMDILEKIKDSMLTTPQVSVAGNHDSQKGEFTEHLNVPITNDNKSRGAYYSYDYNNSHFVVLNTNDNKKNDDNPEAWALGNMQLDWLEKDLADARARNVDWLVLAYHKTLFSGSYHSLLDGDMNRVRERLMQIIDKYDVDLVLNGHDHVLTRTLPLEYSKDAFANGVVDKDAKVLTDVKGNKYIDTKGSIFLIPNTAGTKNYDNIYKHNIDELKKIDSDFDTLTADQLAYYNSLFEYNAQPGHSDGFKEGISNYREGNIQHFAVYSVTKDQLKVEMYEVAGELAKGENPLRKARLIDTFTLVNHNFDLEATNKALLAKDAEDAAKKAAEEATKNNKGELVIKGIDKVYAAEPKASKPSKKQATLPSTGEFSDMTAAFAGLLASMGVGILAWTNKKR
ncbi:fibronectin type III domain-containing protein [Vaginisenegalia massiliensis]|uniref:fibronectin type III domain-containing protein n=1 Tax=Vaginisenegalia massiliensis TaxID=2058294 RepID=UPI000F53633C|nr:metallophosphoesterase [Vaginisenegalia massiliensis]